MHFTQIEGEMERETNDYYTRIRFPRFNVDQLVNIKPIPQDLHTRRIIGNRYTLSMV